MPAKPRSPASDRRRALWLLADGPDGHTTTIMLAHGFTTALLVDLVDAGLASATTERVRRGRKPVEIVRLRITEAGRKVLA
jgi:hypothetical protein